MKWRVKNRIDYAILFVLFAVFTFIKRQYWGTSFAEPHPQKNMRAVGPALGISKQNDPLYYVQYIKVNPSVSEPGVLDTYAHIPFREVALGILLEFSPYGLHYTTRFFANGLGIALIILIYLYLKSIFNKRFALIGSAFMTVSFYINLVSFVIPQDTIMFLFLFLSLYLVNQFYLKNESYYLALAGFSAGLAFNAKYSSALIFVPIVLFSMYANEETITDYFTNSIGFYTAFVIPEILFRLWISHVPEDPILAIPAIVTLLALIPVIKNFGWLINWYRLGVEKCVNDRRLFLIASISGVALLYGVWYAAGFSKFVGPFFTTDPKLLLNPTVYSYMLFNQFKPLLGIETFIGGLLGLCVLPVSSLDRIQKYTVFSFIMATFLYWILTLKVIFFHMYYAVIFGITFGLLATVLLYEILEQASVLIEQNSVSPDAKLAMTICALFVVVVFSYGTVATSMNENFVGKDTQEAAEYLESHSSEEEMFLRQGGSYVLSVSADRKSVNPPMLENQTIKEAIRQHGFGRAMLSFNVTYIVTIGEINPNGFPNPYDTETNIQDIGELRKNIILSEVTGEERPNYITNNVEFGDKVRDSIVLEAEINGYHFYRIEANNTIE
ncbi:glycosyltransferase family 39 protein [Haloarcula marina]|uniref:glycosyltransferase family 39 protein n=1 Tax=Haloarcula marina TaxID=2961574 RepID=UPI0020B82178|nr:glycosyltransferase family 39 protein [Halomicroarcula marina]